MRQRHPDAELALDIDSAAAVLRHDGKPHEFACAKRLPAQSIPVPAASTVPP
jgi:hypothetical protein